MTKKLKKNEWWAWVDALSDELILRSGKAFPLKRDIAFYKSNGFKLVKVRIVEVVE